MDLDALENLKSKISLSSVGKPALIGLAVLLVMVAVTAGRFAIDAATATEIPLERAAQGADEMPSRESSMTDNHETLSEDQVVFVHVSGAVKDPGLVKLASGDRIADAIDAAGGPSDDACIDAVNLARKVEDGEHIHLPNNEEAELESAKPTPTTENRASGNTQGKVNINTASASELEELPGIGPSTAQKIVSDREANGPYESPEDLKRVSGIGAKKYAALEDLICV